MRENERAGTSVPDTKQNYEISQLEGLGVIWAIDKFRPYLSHQKVYISDRSQSTH
jgi:hypothetical protein